MNKDPVPSCRMDKCIFEVFHPLIGPVAIASELRCELIIYKNGPNPTELYLRGLNVKCSSRRCEKEVNRLKECLREIVAADGSPPVTEQQLKNQKLTEERRDRQGRTDVFKYLKNSLVQRAQIYSVRT